MRGGDAMSEIIKCSCDGPDCRIAIHINSGGDYLELWFTDKNGMDSLMYLDADGAVALIRKLRERLMELTA